MKKSGLVTFISAIFPGFGQMYQGYMKRGVSLAFWFWAIVAISALSRISIISIFLIPVWAYSFFDAFNIRSLSPEQRAAFGDAYLPNAQWLNEHGVENKNVRTSKLAGWTMLVIGGLIILGNFWDMLYSIIWRFSSNLAFWFNRLPAILIAAGIIYLGLHLLRKNTNSTPEEDNTPFPTQGDDNNA